MWQSLLLAVSCATKEISVSHGITAPFIMFLLYTVS